MIKKLLYTSFGLITVFCLNSCLVTNNFYVNDPYPTKGDNNAKFYVGAASSVTPKIDSTSSTTNAVYFSNKISRASIFTAGTQVNIKKQKQLDLRIAAYLPRILGGLGLRAGCQYRIFNADSKFNMALGTDFGAVFSRDSIRIGGSRFGLDNPTGAGVNADLFLPIGYKIKDDISIILTPRYSLNNIKIRDQIGKRDGHNFKFNVPLLTLGIRIKGFYMEANAIYYNKTIYPQAELGVIIHPN